ncbi:MAG: CocE/NonD family hydrolase [Pseudomonadota bacterium]
MKTIIGAVATLLGTALVCLAEEVRETEAMPKIASTRPIGPEALPREALSTEWTRIAVEISGYNFELDALIVAPAEAKAGDSRPGIVISHGNPRKLSFQRQLRLHRYGHLAEEFARRGFVAMVVARRGFAGSDGGYAEWYADSCETATGAGYTRAGLTGARDYAAALEVLAADPRVDPGSLMAAGISGGGFASLALASDPPKGLRGVINFSGGRGSGSDNMNCNEEGLAEAFAAFGTSYAAPSLWLYSETDRFFWPEMVYRHFDSFGGPARLHMYGAILHAEDGHRLFQRGNTSMWRPAIDRFLMDIAIPTWSEPPADPGPLDLPAPPGLNARGQKAWVEFQGSEFSRAFAVGENGSFGWGSGYASPEAAADAAIEACSADKVQTCAIHMIDEIPQ